jgi:hypothetical protein
MDDLTRTNLATLHSQDKESRYRAFLSLLEATDNPVDWAYDAWDDLVALLRQGDNHQRAMAAQLLTNLARSDPQKRMLRDFDALLAVTRDERSVTARHALQAIWKVGLAGPEQSALVLAGLTQRFGECRAEKNGTLIRYDICAALRQLYAAVQDETTHDLAMRLIATEDDVKYRAKYADVWKQRRRA